jgi:hypothetical protein
MTTKKKSAKSKSKSTMGEAVQIPLSMADAFEKGVVLYVKMGAPGFITGIDVENVDAGDVDPEMLRLSKKTLDCPQYKAMKSVHGQVKKFLRGRTLPVPRYMRSAYFIPDEQVEETIKGIEQYVNLHDDEYLPAFLRVYRDEKLKAKERLKNLYDESDYPSVESLRRSCYIRPEIIEITTPKRLEGISPSLYRAQREALRQKMAETANDGKMYLRDTLFKLLTHLHEKLAASDPATGRPTVIRKASVDHIEDFLKFFESLNVTKDTPMEATVEKLRKNMAGLDLEIIKHDDKYRASMAATVGAIARDLGALVTVAPRKIRLPKAG